MIDVCTIVSHGFAARTVLHTDVIPRLRQKGLRVAVVSPNAHETHFAELCERVGAEAHLAPATNRKWQIPYTPLRRYLLEDVRRNPALWAKHEYELKAPGLHPLQRLPPAVGSALLPLGRWRHIWRPQVLRAERLALRNTEVAGLLRRLDPRVVVSTYPVSWLEATFLREAQVQGRLTAGQLLSWDNLTCKGHLSVVPERFIAWGPIMRQELEQIYGIAPEAIDECGVAHFDAHRDPEAAARSRQSRERLGLNPDAPYLFFGMSAAIFAPKEIEVVEHLARQVAAHRFGRDMQLVIRPHPQNIRGSMATPGLLNRLQSLRSGRVAIDIPEVVSDRLPWDLDRADLAWLSSLLAGASVCLNSGSTLSIDALIHDTPVVLPLFDAESSLPDWQSVRRVARFPHLAKLLDYGGIDVVHSFTKLDACIAAVVESPDNKRDWRREALRAECGSMDGQAAERIADALTRLAVERGADALQPDPLQLGRTTMAAHHAQV